MNLIIISFVLTSKLAYKCTGYAYGFTSETPPVVYRVSLKYLRILDEVS